MEENTFVPQTTVTNRNVFFILAAMFSLSVVFVPASVKAAYVGGYIQDVATGLTQPLTLNGATYMLNVNNGGSVYFHYDAPVGCSSVGVYVYPLGTNFSISNGQSGTITYGPLPQTSQTMIDIVCTLYDSTTIYAGVYYQVYPPGPACGSAQGVYSGTMPGANLCSIGTAAPQGALPACSTTTGCTFHGGSLYECPYDYFDGEQWIVLNQACSTNFTSAGWYWYCNSGSSILCSAPSQLPNGCSYNRDASGNAVTNITTYTSSPSGGKYKAGNYGNYCWGNSGGPNYFVPANTWAEFSTFWNNISSLSGIYIIN